MSVTVRGQCVKHLTRTCFLSPFAFLLKTWPACSQHKALGTISIVPSTQHVRMQLQTPVSRHHQSALFTWLHPRCTQPTAQQYQSCHQLPGQIDGAGFLQQPLKRQRRSSAWRGCSVQAYSAPAMADIISRVRL